MEGKSFYHQFLKGKLRIPSIKLDKNIAGTTPPSVFVGSWRYPNVYVGPMVTPQHGDTTIMDTPELWFSKNTEDILQFRLQLVRGKQVVSIRDTGNKLVSKLQEVALASSSVNAEAEFQSVPRGIEFDRISNPMGPSAVLEKFSIDNIKWNQRMEKAYYDRDLKASEAVANLYENDVSLSQIQKALSVGSFGIGKNRKLVPTKWSITATDDIVCKQLMERVRDYPSVNEFSAFFASYLGNSFHVLLMPGSWEFENFESWPSGSAWQSSEEYDPFEGRKSYADKQVGGYYASRLGVVEHLNKIRRQARVVVFREISNEYVIPMGVWVVRECVRAAMRGNAEQFSTLQSALEYIGNRTSVKMQDYRKSSRVLQQRRVIDF